MPLITSNKATSANSNTPSKVITRQEVSMGKPSASTARVQALKDKIMGKAPTQPIAPRPAGTTGRREEMAKLNKFTTSPQNVVQKPPSQHKMPDVDLNSIPPPPSGLAPGQVAPSAQLTSTVEAPKLVAEAPNDTLSPQQAALARKEQLFRKAQQEFKAEQEAWKLQQAGYIPKERLTSDTLKVLAEAGITPDKYLELQTRQVEAADPNQPLLDRISQLEGKITELTDPENGTLAKEKKASYDAALNQIRSDVKLVVDSNPTYGTIKSEGKTEDVVELVTRVFEEENIILDVEEAVQLVEAKLVDRLSKQYERIGKYDKIKSRFGQKTESSEVNNEQQPQSPQSKTLTNAGSTQRQLTPRERAVLKVQEAIEARKGR